MQEIVSQEEKLKGPGIAISGFSKLSKSEKLQFLDQHLESSALLEKFQNSYEEIQKTLDQFSENTLTNFPLPFGVVPNLLINQKLYTVPLVIEESSVVAACSSAALFWKKRAGVKTKIKGTEKIGQIHFVFQGDKSKFESFFKTIKPHLMEGISFLAQNMRQRGGGPSALELHFKDGTPPYKGTGEGPYYYGQILAKFETCDAMGANFINSLLENMASSLQDQFSHSELFFSNSKLEIIMSILSNYTPNCLVRAEVSCPLEDLDENKLGMSPGHFAQKMVMATWIAQNDIHRATTHNKGIMNGIDAVILATGNDFRAVEACVHTFAGRSGTYQGLTQAQIKDGHFHFWLEIPLAVGTVGGLTSLHPLSKFSLELLGSPSAQELMEIMAAVGLMQNFAALKSLVTSGIQKGHMKMHLLNILNGFKATEEESEKTKIYFKDKTISYNAVREFLNSIRTWQ